MITKQHAEDIARKLRAIIDKRASAHDRALIYHEDKLIAHFGIRRGSNRNIPHDYIPKEIHMSPRDTKQLAECSITSQQWIQRLKEKGIILDA